MQTAVEQSLRTFAVLCVHGRTLDENQKDRLLRLIQGPLNAGDGYGIEDLDADRASLDGDRISEAITPMVSFARSSSSLLLRRYAWVAFMVHGRTETLLNGEVRFIAGLLGIPEAGLEHELREAARFVADEFNAVPLPGARAIAAEDVQAILDGRSRLVGFE